MAAPLLRAAVLLVACTAVLGIGPAWYKCDENKCKLPDCQCATVDPPGGLAPEDTPQFIVLTHDDAITVATDVNIRAIIDRHKNRNGCNMPATFFVLKQDTDCDLARKFWELNSELAIHSTTHVPLTPFTPAPNGPFTLKDEMLGARTFLNETCGIPLEDLVGFRTPLLAHSPPVRQVLFDAGFLYDSSIPEIFPSVTSPNASERLWPYTMDAGIPQDCGEFAGTQCTETERYQGLWQIPMLETEDPDGKLVGTMDPGLKLAGEGYNSTAAGTLSAAEVEHLLRTNFDFSYNGNRSPFGIYIHTFWFSKDTIEGTNAFLDYALGLDNVWVITNRQLLEWMQDPVPASEMDDWIKCAEVNVTAPPIPGTQKCLIVSVKAGQTAAVIAETYDVTLDQLQGLNPSVNLTMLSVGQPLLIPPFDDTCPDPPAPGAAAGSEKQQEQEQPQVEAPPPAEEQPKEAQAASAEAPKKKQAKDEGNAKN